MPTKNAQRSNREQHRQQQPKQVFEVARSKRERRSGRPNKKAEPVPIVAEVKSVMHRIFESQREHLIKLSEIFRKSGSLAGRRWISAGKKFSFAAALLFRSAHLDFPPLRMAFERSGSA
jgi:hypothetical protein